MDIASLLGIFAGIGVIVHALMTGAAPPESFWNVASIEIVLGGTIAATLLSFPLKEVLRIANVSLIIFKKGGMDRLGPFVNEVVEIVARRGGIDAARAKASKLAAGAEEELVHLPESSARDALGHCLTYAIERRR